MSENVQKPRIRFKGFSDAWEQRKLGEVATITKGQSKIAMNLIKIGTPCKIIAQATGFSEEEVSRLKKEMSNA